MKKLKTSPFRITLFLIPFLILVSCSIIESESGIVTSYTTTPYPIDMPLNEFLIGNWEAGVVQATDVYGEYQLWHHVTFINENTLEFCANYSNTTFCDNFTYSLIGESRYLIENRRAREGEWTIDRNGEMLYICVWHLDNCYNFSRTTEFSFP